jgi:hypothetical protein
VVNVFPNVFYVQKPFPAIYTIFIWSHQKCKRGVLLCAEFLFTLLTNVPSAGKIKVTEFNSTESTKVCDETVVVQK